MAMVTDPVCGMRIDSDDAAATAVHEGNDVLLVLTVVPRRVPRGSGLVQGLIDRMGDDRLTVKEVADRAGTSVNRIRRLVDLGILEDRGSFARREVMRARVAADLERKGSRQRASRRRSKAVSSPSATWRAPVGSRPAPIGASMRSRPIWGSRSRRSHGPSSPSDFLARTRPRRCAKRTSRRSPRSRCSRCRDR